MEMFWTAVLLSFVAGLSTTIGGFIALALKKPGPKVLSLVMGASAGVMIYISFVELLQEGIAVFGILVGTMFFLAGLGLMFLIDMTISHKYHINEEYFQKGCNLEERLQRTSFFVFLGIFIHNAPEGIATLAGTLENLEIGIILTIAIALHNIPEGIAVAAPSCAIGEDKKKSLFLAFLSGMSEPLGALIFGLLFLPFLNEAFLGALLAFVGGIMVYISVDELLPVSHCFGDEKLSIIGLVLGMFIMAVSISLL